MQKCRLFALLAFISTSTLFAQYPYFPIVDDPLCATNGNYVEIDYLLWFSSLEGLSFDSDIRVFNSTTSELLNISETDDFFRSKWSSGLKVLAGFQPFQTWDLACSYTYLPIQIQSTRNAIAQSNDFLIGDVLATAFDVFAIRASSTLIHARWRLNFNQFDVQLGTDLNVAGAAQFHPFFGVRALWLNQRFRNTFTFVASTGRTTVLDFDALSSYRGVGPRAGFELSLPLFNAFETYGNVAAGVLWGHFTQKQSSYDVALQTVNQQFGEAVRHSHSTALYSLDVGLGLRWKKWINFTQQIGLTCGWEQHFYSNLNRVQNLNPIIIDNIVKSPFDHNIQRRSLSFGAFVFGASYWF